MRNEYPHFRGDNPFASQAKMLCHLDRLGEWKSTGTTSAPVLMEINLTNRCNLACPWCINENFRGDDSLTMGRTVRFIRDYADMGGRALTFSGGGEPTLHPLFLRFAREAKRAGLHLGLMTNGTVSGLTNTIRETFEWVRVSLDTTDLVTYRRWKQSDLLPVVLANIERMYGGQAKVGVNVNVGPEHTPEMVEKLVNDVAEICDYIQFRPVLPRCWMTEGVEVNEEVWDLLRTLAAVESTISLSDDKLSDIVSGNTFPFRSCEAHHFEPILNANGDVCACMYHPKDKRFVFGNIYEERFQEIWNGPRRKAVAEEIRGIDYKKECQVCCKGTEVNKFLDYVAHPEEVEDRCFL